MSPYLLAVVMGAAGVLHFVTPEFYERLIPPFLGPPRPWIYASGVAEIACAAAVAVPRTRRLGGYATAALLAAVFPGNVYMAFEPGDLPRWAALLRLPLQVPLVLWGVQVGRDAGR